jgi:IS605 OrfB family transposase
MTVVGDVKRAILLQTEATKHKLRSLRAFVEKATECSNFILSKRIPNESATDLQARVLQEAKKRYGFNVQVVCSIVRGLAKSRSEALAGTTVKFNVPRNCKTFRTKGFFFVELGTYPGHRFAIPLRRNRNLDRFFGHLASGWTCKTFGLTPSLEIVAYLSKEEELLQQRSNILGIDINAKSFAYTVLAPDGEVLKQGYLGQQIWAKKRRFEERRATLQSLNALKKLKQMRHRQRNYVKTNIGQLVREIIVLAQKHEADISIENLRRFKPKGRSFNRKVMTLPFYLFRRTLKARCFDNGITLNKEDAYHTSKWCSHCGAVGKGHDGNVYALFRCRDCGQVVNADRKASLAVAVKTLSLRSGFPNQGTLQISGRRVPVNGLFRVPDAPESMAVPALPLGRGKPTGFSCG